MDVVDGAVPGQLWPKMLLVPELTEVIGVPQWKYSPPNCSTPITWP